MRLSTWKSPTLSLFPLYAQDCHMGAVALPMRWRTPSARLARGHGSANLLSLAAISDATGDSWEKMRETSSRHLEQLLHQQLGPADFFLPIDEVTYLIVMPGATPIDGQISCVRIAYDLHTNLLGSCSIDKLQIARARVTAEDVLEMEYIERSELLDLVNKAELTLTAGNSDGSAPRLIDAAAHPEPVKLTFVPVWHAGHEVLMGYRCLPLDGWHRHGPEISVKRIREVTQVIASVIEQGLVVLETRLRRNERFILNLPIPYEVLNAPVPRMQLMSLCRRFDSELRPYLSFTLEDLPLGVPQSRIAEIVTILHCFCGSILVHIPRGLFTLAAFEDAGVTGLGLSLRASGPAFDPDKIALLAAETKKIGVAAFLDNVDSLEAFRCALDNGIDWLSGDTIAHAIDVPGPLRRLSKESIIRNIAAV